MLILGISAFYHDSAAALIDPGRIVAAAQEDRFSHKKSTMRASPVNAIQYCLGECGIKLGGIDHVVSYDKLFIRDQ